MSAPAPVADHKAGPFPGFEGVRTIAVVSAMIQHVGFVSGLGFDDSLGGHLVRHLEIGSAIFYILSAFLLYRAFSLRGYRGRQSEPVRDFWWRRALRVMPAYWLALGFLLVPFLFGLEHNGVGDIFRFVTLTHVYSGDLFYKGIQQSYTLAVELGFYLLLPAYAWVINRLARGSEPNRRLRIELVGAVVLYATGILWRALVYSRRIFPEIGYEGGAFAIPAEHWLPGYFDIFGLGMGTAAVHAWSTATEQPARLMNRLARFPDACFGVAVGCYLVVTLALTIPVGPVTTVGFNGYTRSALQGVCALFLLIPAAFGDQTRGLYRWFLQWRPIAYFGMVSYGVYLWHEGFLIHALTWLGVEPRVLAPGEAPTRLFHGPYWPLFLITIAGSVAGASLSYYLVEKPLSRFKNRPPWRRRASSSAGSP